MLDILKRVLSRKQTWVTLAGVATTIPAFISGNYQEGLKSIIGIFAGQ